MAEDPLGDSILSGSGGQDASLENISAVDVRADETEDNCKDVVADLRDVVSTKGSGLGLKLDVTLVLTAPSDNKGDTPELPLFSLISTNPEKAPTIEVPWSQLLALSLSPLSDPPVLTVGRHKDCNVQLDDPRVSVRHFDIVARKKYSVDTEDSELGSITYDCILNDSSSNGTLVNGTAVGKGNSCHLHSGDEVCVLSTAAVGLNDAISWVFRNTTEVIAMTHTSAEANKSKDEAAESKLMEHILCPICMLVIYKCVALMPCFHNFCAACYSDWIAKKHDCPVCREQTSAVMKNHAMEDVIEALLETFPEHRRSEDERRDMDARDTLKLGVGGQMVREIAKPQVAPTAIATDIATTSTRTRPSRRTQACALQ